MSELIGCGPLAAIDGPPPFAPRYGLLQAAGATTPGVRFVDETGERWLNGAEAFHYPAHEGAFHTPFYEGTADNSKDDGDPFQNPQFWPGTVYVTDRCSTFAIKDDQQYRQRILLKLDAVESSEVANVLMTGATLPVAAPHLNDGEGEFPNGNTAVSLAAAVAILENLIGTHHRGGVIHMTPRAALLLSASGYIFRPDPLGTRNMDVLRTTLGTLVIPDGGYIGAAGPTGHTQPSSSQEWLYASGAIDVRRTDTFVNPPEMAQAVDRGMGATLGLPNTLSYQAERHYLVAWDTTIQAAVLANYS